MRDIRWDDDLRARFRELHDAEAHGAPSFPAVLESRAPRRTRPTVPAFAWAALAVVLVAGAVVLARPRRLTLPREVAALSRWRPMTDALLSATDLTPVTHAPRLGASLITINTQGVLR